jgi:anaerobic selenocysteine-containing dehydrogenase
METLKDLDFYVDVDMFRTAATDYADIILPSTSTFEHGSLTMRGGDEIYYTPPIISPVGESRSDLDIICALAKRIATRDTLLCSGSEACCDNILHRLDLSLEMVRGAAEPVRVNDVPVQPGEYTAAGYRTPSGKYELKSTLMHRDGYADLPEYVSARVDKTMREYPFILSVGNRQTYGFHSRMNRVMWIRALYPAPAVDINADDAAELGISMNDQAEIVTALGSVRMRANITRTIPRGMVCALSDYREADLGAILPLDACDECCGVPAYRTMSCMIRKV